MAGINAGKVVVGGLVAGVIINISEFILNNVVLASEMAKMTTAHNLTPLGIHAIAFFVAFGFAEGLILTWLYAAVRPRLGPGPRTAALTGLVVWFFAFFWSSALFAALGICTGNPMMIGLVWSLVETMVASNVGAMLYTEA